MSCTIAYAIGVAEPVSVFVETYGTGKISNKEIVGKIRDHFDLRPKGITQQLNLLRPIYRQTAAYGHFGNDKFPWEKLDRVRELAI